VFPVQPAAKATYPACHHDYPASDIFTPVGSRFVAVTSGVVDFVSFKDTWQPEVDDPVTRGGLSVALIGDDGVRYYGSHLSQIADSIQPGVRVSAGQLLGLTGNSGTARPTPPHLHFGISQPTTPNDWAVRRGQINPYPYLNDWKHGQDRTPDLSQPGGGAC
jgi:murein DD-endopeptidase MepM/ murein hydrolase activator NlpD